MVGEVEDRSGWKAFESDGEEGAQQSKCDGDFPSRIKSLGRGPELSKMRAGPEFKPDILLTTKWVLSWPYLASKQDDTRLQDSHQTF